MKTLFILLTYITSTTPRILTFDKSEKNENYPKNSKKAKIQESSERPQNTQILQIPSNPLIDPERKAGIEIEFGFFPCTYQDKNFGRNEKGKIKDGIKLKFDFEDTDLYMLGYDKSSIYSDSYKEEKSKIYKNFFKDTTNFYDYEFRTIGGLTKKEIFSGIEHLKNFFNPICENLKNSQIDDFVLNHQDIDLCLSDKVSLKENEKMYIFVKPQFTFDIKINELPEFILKINKGSDFILKQAQNILMENDEILVSEKFINQYIIDSMNYFKGIYKLNGRKENFFIISLFANCFVLDKFNDTEEEKNLIIEWAKNNILKIFFEFLPRYPDHKLLKNFEIRETFFYLKENKLDRIIPFTLNFRDNQIKEDFKKYIRLEIEEVKEELKKIPDLLSPKGDIKKIKEKDDIFINLDQEAKNQYRYYNSLKINLEKNGFFNYSFENYLIDLLIFQKYKQNFEEDFEIDDFHRCEKDHIFNCLYLTNETKLLATTMVDDFQEDRIILEYRGLFPIKTCEIDRELKGLLNLFFGE